MSLPIKLIERTEYSVTLVCSYFATGWSAVAICGCKKKRGQALHWYWRLLQHVEPQSPVVCSHLPTCQFGASLSRLPKSRSHLRMTSETCCHYRRLAIVRAVVDPGTKALGHFGHVICTSACRLQADPASSIQQVGHLISSHERNTEEHWGVEKFRVINWIWDDMRSRILMDSSNHCFLYSF